MGRRQGRRGSCSGYDNPSLAAAVTAAYALLDKLTADRNAAGRAAAKRKGKGATPATGDGAASDVDG